MRLEPSTSLLNKTNTCDGHNFNIDIFTDEVNALQKESLVLFEGFFTLVTGNFTKFALYFGCGARVGGTLDYIPNPTLRFIKRRVFMVVNKTMYGNNEDVPDTSF